MLERIIDIAADELDIDPAEIRRRNFLPPDEFPYTTVMRTTTTAATTTPRSTRRSRSRATTSCGASRRSGVRRGDRVALGIGVSAYVEVTGGAAVEYGAVEVDADGIVTVQRSARRRTGRATPRRSR